MFYQLKLVILVLPFLLSLEEEEFEEEVGLEVEGFRKRRGR